MRSDNVPVIFGFKLRNLRETHGLGLKELSERVGMSPSYLNEIEKGKKYPKADKILHLAEAFNLGYDEMVSLKLGSEFGPIEAFLDSPVIQALPLKLFGLTPHDVIDLITRAPQEVSALLHALADISSNYNMHVEHFFHAMLRSHQETRNSYFEELEDGAAAFRAKQGWEGREAIALEPLREVLEKKFKVRVDETRLEEYPELNEFRSIWIAGPPPTLLLNPKLTERQKAFQIAREIGYRAMHLKERGQTSSRAAVASFAQVLNDFKASYYAGALLIDQELLVARLKTFFHLERWSESAFAELIAPFEVTPEMFLYRLTQIVPKRFNLKKHHFIRISHNTANDSFEVTKQFNRSGLLIPVGLGRPEHHCRRWIAVDILRDLAKQHGRGTPESHIIGAQRARFLNSGDSYFLISLARPLALTEGANTSVTIGFLLDRGFKQLARFWDDAEVPDVDVNESCQRCGLSVGECYQRAAPPTLFEHEQRVASRNESLERLTQVIRSS